MSCLGKGYNLSWSSGNAPRDCITRRSCGGHKASVVLLLTHLFQIQARAIVSTDNSKRSQRLLKFVHNGFYPD